ncbi:MAG TPA: GTPase [Polyangiaceae bacterium]|nr:GTPase [Polyangiaceae bacterium]
MSRRRVLILGAAGRDFHNFNTVYRGDDTHEVVAFTATQIPKIDGRRYPTELAGRAYPQGIPIEKEEDLEKIVAEHDIDEVVFAYSDVPYSHVMHLASRALTAGADFRILGARDTMIEASVPIVAVTAVRTGCGKSPTTRYLIRALKESGRKVVVVRHPMPYGDLAKQAVQRFETYDDLDRHECTFEEREEYESHIDEGTVVYAGVDYGAILDEASKEADVVFWDGGNNDWPFYKPDVWVTITDPLRPGHELGYFPGEVNLRGAHIVVINKVNTAPAEDVELVAGNIARANPDAAIMRTNSVVTVDGDASQIKGKRVLCIEDGPTLTHGGMTFGAGNVAAEKYGAAEIVEPRPHAVGSIAETYEKYPHMVKLLPAMGYFPEQIADLEATIKATDCDVVLIGTPFDLGRKLNIDKPALRVRYATEDTGGGPTLAETVLAQLDQKVGVGA